MRLSITHEIEVPLDPPAKAPILLLRLTPTNFDAQQVRHWRIESGDPALLRGTEDSFGNFVHVFTSDTLTERVSLTASGEVETYDAAGMVRSAPERFPPTLFLRETAVTTPSPELRLFAEEVGVAAEPLDMLHKLMHALADRFPLAEEGEGKPTVEEAFEEKAATARDHAHLFATMARCLELPARVASGYWVVSGKDEVSAGTHVWAEAHVAGLGWVGFDSAHRTCPTDHYIRLAAALDCDGAVPVVGLRAGQEAKISVTARILDGF